MGGKNGEWGGVKWGGVKSIPSHCRAAFGLCKNLLAGGAEPWQVVLGETAVGR